MSRTQNYGGSTICQSYSVHLFCCQRKRQYSDKNLDLPPVIDIYKVTTNTSWPQTGIELDTLVVIGTDCICKYLSNYCIFAATASLLSYSRFVESTFIFITFLYLSFIHQFCFHFLKRVITHKLPELLNMVKK